MICSTPRSVANRTATVRVTSLSPIRTRLRILTNGLTTADLEGTPAELRAVADQIYAVTPIVPKTYAKGGTARMGKS